MADGMARMLCVQSEYVSEADTRRAFISEFTGSAGTAVVLHKEAFLWTDGRYVLQASQQCDPAVWTIKHTQPKSLTMPDHLPDTLPPASKVPSLPPCPLQPIPALHVRHHPCIPLHSVLSCVCGMIHAYLCTRSSPVCAV